MLVKSLFFSVVIVATLFICLILPFTAFGSESVIYSEGFEDGNGGYTADGNVLWEWGAPAKPSGPAAANSGSKCWGTIPTSSVAGTLEGNIYSPSITIPALTAGQLARVRFHAYVDINYEKYGEGDFYISADGMQTWRLLGRFYEKMSGGWQRYVFDVSEYAGKNVNIRFRVNMQDADPGFYVDDVAVTVEDTPVPATLLTLEASEDAAESASCPWVYVWNGTEFVKDNDIYSVARYQQGEMRDYYLLQQPLVAQGNHYNLEIREVESEDSWTDFIGLLAVDHRPDVAIAPDGKGNVLAYRPSRLNKPISAIGITDADVLTAVSDRDNSGYKAYSGDSVELDFGAVNVSAGARVLLRVKGFLQGWGEVKPFSGPPAIVVQMRDSNAAWQEIGRLNPRFEWSEGVFELSPELLDPFKKLRIRLTSISHDTKYHEIDLVALDIGPQPKMTVTELPLLSATFGSKDVLPLLSVSDNDYVQMASGNKFKVSFADLHQSHGLVRDFILVSEGYYVPKSSTYFIYTWDGAHWVQRDSHSFAATDSVRTFDLSSVLPDPAGEYKVRIWQDYSNWAAAIDFAGLQVGALAGILDTATDLRNGSDIFSLVQTSDDNWLLYARNAVTKDPRDRWTQYRWAGLPANIPPSIPAGQLTLQDDSISWSYFDADGNPQVAFEAQIWTGPGATGKCLWSPPTVASTETSLHYAASSLSVGTYYVRVRLSDGVSWGGWTEASFVIHPATLAPTVNITTPVNGASLAAPVTITISAMATASSGATVSQVDFYAGTTLVGSATTSLYSITWSNVPAGSYSLTARVTDSLNATATSTPISITVSDNILPTPWVSQDIGNVGLAGSTGYVNGTFSLSGAGADIWGTGDGFRYVYQSLTGDGQIIARVASLQNTNIWAKGGVMIRETLAANCSHVLMAVTPGVGSAFQRRLTTGALSVNTTGPRVTAPYWVKLVRSGNTFSGYVSSNGVSWTLVGSDTINMANSVLVGLAVTSHTKTALCTAAMDGVSVTTGIPHNPPTAIITMPTEGASFAAPANIAITATVSDGSEGAVNRVDFYAGTTLVGSAAISPYSITWSNVPAGNYSLTAQVIDNMDASNSSDPVGITVADDALPSSWSSRDIGTVGVVGSSTYQNGTFTVSGAGADIWGTGDGFRYVYQSLTGDGQIIARVASLQNTNIWAKGGVMIRETLTPNSSHALMALTPGVGAVFQRRLTSGSLSLNTAGPRVTAPYWVKLVRSGNTFSGYVSSNGVSWTLVGSDTIAMADTVYIGLAVTSHTNTAICTAAMDGVSVTLGTPVIPTTVSISIPTNGASFAAPASMAITATPIAGTGATVSRVDFYAGTALVGSSASSPYSITWDNVPVGSYSLTAQVIDSLGVTTNSLPVVVYVNGPALPSPWATLDIGAVGVPGNATYQDGTFTINGAGADIWGTADAFRYVYQPLTGDGQIVARVAAQQNTNIWAKGGVMIRETLAANSSHALMALTPGIGAAFQRRLVTGGLSVNTTGPRVAVPYWVKLVRSGNTFSGYVSSDGENWIQVGSDTIAMAGTVYVGLAVTSHNKAALCAATMDGVH